MNGKRVVLVILTILLILGGVGIGVYLVQQDAEIREKAAPATTMALTTSNTSPIVGEDIIVTVEINTGENQIPGVEMLINYDPTILEAINVSPGTFFTNPQQIGPNIDNDVGTVFYVLWILPGSTAKQGQGDLANITFKTKNTGSSQISFDSEKTIVGAIGESGTGSEYDRVNALIGTTPITINVLAAGLPTETPIPTTTQAITNTPIPTPTEGDGIGGADPTSTPTNTPVPTSTPSPSDDNGGSSTNSDSPTATPQLPPIPDSGISLPTLAGLAVGILTILGALILAF